MKNRRTLSGKKARRSAILALTLIFMMLFSAVLTFALTEETDEADDYKYTIRIYAGNVDGARINGGDYVEYKLGADEKFTFNQSSVTGYDTAKYYVNGIRQAGIDNYDPEHPQLTGNVAVEGDMDYVVAYGILGSSARYTVNYQDTSGKQLSPSETY